MKMDFREPTQSSILHKESLIKEKLFDMHRPCFGYQTENFKHHLGADAGGVGGWVVLGGDFHHITAHQIQTAQPPDQSLSLPCRQAAHFRRSSARRVGRIQPVHIKRYVGGAIADNLAGLIWLSPEAQREVPPAIANWLKERM